MLYCAKLRESIIEDSSSIQRIALAFPALELLDGKSSANSTSPRLALADRDASPLVEPASSSTAIVSPIIPTDSERKRSLARHMSISSNEHVSKDPYELTAVEQAQPANTDQAPRPSFVDECADTASLYLSRARQDVEDLCQWPPTCLETAQEASHIRHHR